MTMELVTGHAGAAHVSGADVGAFNAGTIGDGTYILASSLPVLSMLDANTLEVPVCEILAEGRHVRITAAESVTIESGSQTGYRNDIVYLRYNLDSGTGEETATLVVANGTTVANQSDVVDPTTEYSSASILDGATTVDIPFARIRLAGLTPTPEWVVENMDSTDSRLDDAETGIAGLTTQLHNTHIYAGSIVRNYGGGQDLTVWTDAQFKSSFNTTQPGQCAVALSNGDGSAQFHDIVAARYQVNQWKMYLFSAASAGPFRINYIVCVPAEYSTI